jgi:hypothetical protein
MTKKYAAEDSELYELSQKLLKEAHEARWHAYEPTAVDIAELGGKLSPSGKAEYQEHVRRIKRDQILAARDKDDIKDAFAIAGTDKKLLAFLAERLHRKRGEQKTRPRDHNPAKASQFDALLAESALLRQLWKEHNIKVRAPRETALHVIVKRERGGERLLSALTARYKNRARARRSR